MEERKEPQSHREGFLYVPVNPFPAKSYNSLGDLRATEGGKRVHFIASVLHGIFRVRRAAPSRACAEISHATWLMASSINILARRNP